MDVAGDQLENFVLELRDIQVKLKDGSTLSIGSNLRLSRVRSRRSSTRPAAAWTSSRGPRLPGRRPNTYFPARTVGAGPAQTADVLEVPTRTPERTVRASRRATSTAASSSEREP